MPEPFASFVKVFDFGPGCKIRRVFTTEDAKVVRYWMSLWGTLHFAVKIDLEDYLLNIDPKSLRCEGIVLPGGRAMQISPYLRTVSQQAPGKE